MATNYGKITQTDIADSLAKLTLNQVDNWAHKHFPNLQKSEKLDFPIGNTELIQLLIIHNFATTLTISNNINTENMRDNILNLYNFKLYDLIGFKIDKKDFANQIMKNFHIYYPLWDAFGNSREQGEEAKSKEFYKLSETMTRLFTDNEDARIHPAFILGMGSLFVTAMETVNDFVNESFTDFEVIIE